MTTKIINIAHPDEKVLTARQAIERANLRGNTILSNLELDERLVKTGAWRSDFDFLSPWSGTFCAYGRPEESLKDIIQITDSGPILGPQSETTYIFEVPEKARGAKDVILAVNHGFGPNREPLITYEDKKDNVVLIKIHDTSKIKIIEGFPECNGPYLTDSEFGIPIGNIVNPSLNSRYLFRVDGSWCGFAARRVCGFTVDLFRPFSSPLEVLGVEATAETATAIVAETLAGRINSLD